MLWKLEDWQYPCYNINNGRCKALLKWNNSKNIIYEETTNNIIPILSFKRPHSRAFILSFILIILIFITQFHLISFNFIKSSYYNEIPNDIIRTEVRYTIIYLYIGSTISRAIFGYIADRIGIRISYCILILLSVLFGILNIIKDNPILKILNGIISGGFVLSELWVITMFDTNILGITTGILGGVGNFGIGIIYIINYTIISSIDEKLLKYYIYWPYILLLLTIYPIYYLSDDCPYGNYIELKKLYNERNNIDDIDDIDDNIDNTIYSNGNTNYSLDNNINIENIVVDISFSKSKCFNILKNIKLLALCLTYLYSFGIELTIYSNLPILLKIEDNISLNKKILLLFAFSSINLLGRPIGGYISDKNYGAFKIIGKIKLILVFIASTVSCGLILNNFMQMLNSDDEKYYQLLLLIILWSFSNNLLQGTIIGIIPHMDSSNLGLILGIIASFGSIGGILGNILFIYYNDYTSLKIINISGGIIFAINTLVLL